MNKKKSTLHFATWLRACAAMMVLLCHLCNAAPVRVIQMAAQFFNIGVPIFFLLSGFLFGYNGVKKPYHRWLWKRTKRIYFPMWLFMAILLCIHVGIGHHDRMIDWILMFFGMQGSAVRIYGAVHLWFITPILICYLATPLIVWVIERLEKRGSRNLTIYCIGGACAVPALLGLLPQAFWIAIYGPVIEFAFAFAAGRYYNRRTNERRKWIIGASAAIVIVFTVRLIARSVCDGTILYDRLIAWYTHVIGAMGICILFSIFLNNAKPPKAVKAISNYSFEIYLYHHMFITGPIVLCGILPHWTMDWIMITAVSFVAAWAANRLLFQIENLSSRKNMRKRI